MLISKTLLIYAVCQHLIWKRVFGADPDGLTSDAWCEDTKNIINVILASNHGDVFKYAFFVINGLKKI